MKGFRLIPVLVAVLFLVSACGVSSGGVLPGFTSEKSVEEISSNGPQLWGLYDVTFDPATQTAEIIPLRSASVELNVVKFLEPPGKYPHLTITNVYINGSKVQCTVNIKHPFAGYPEYTGFTVRGVILTDGTMASFDDPEVVISAPSELRLTNADGLTRWMNPVEFPFDDTILNYYPGKNGHPAGDAFKSTVNPFKLFADDLDISDDLDLNENLMAMFSPGKTNRRIYHLDFGSQLKYHFQYAVLASVETPINYPPNGPEDFPPGTAASEPWRVDVVETTNELWYENGEQGGDFLLQVLVRDFENADQDTVFIEAPGVFDRQEMPLIAQDGNHLTFELAPSGITLASADPFEILITAVAKDGEGYDNRLPGKELATYQLHQAEVSAVKPQPSGWPFYDDFENYNYIWTPYGGDWWGKAGGYMDAAGGESCYENNNGSPAENTNVSYVSSPPIEVPPSTKDLLLVINHTIDVDIPEELGHFAWDMCFVRMNGEQVFPTGGPPYEDNYYPWTFDPMKCWTSYYPMTESTFNLGTGYNGTTVTIEFVLDAYDNIDNCDPPNAGWLIDDVLLDFAD
ncbi:MAG: hypothetical protein ABIC40_04995 [bacterium]